MLQPLGNKVLLKPLPAEAVTDGGIALPDAARTEQYLATVIAIGPAVTCLAVGDTVYYAKYAGQEITYLKEDYLMLEEENVLAREAAC